jgi:hypothetical protein
MFVMVSSLNLNKHLPEMVRDRQQEASPGYKKVNLQVLAGLHMSEWRSAGL